MSSDPAQAATPECPACRTPTSAVLWSVGADEAAQAFLRKESDPSAYAELSAHIAGLWRGGECSVMHCAACGVGFAHPFVSGDERFYNLAYPGTPGYPKDKWEFALTVDDLRKTDASRVSSFRCLEIGAGVGNFLVNLARFNVPNRNVLALEYNAESRRMLDSRGFAAKAVDVRTLDDSPFGLIFMFQVLEHMADLDGVFSKLRELLAKDGALYVAVPNPERIAFNEENGTLKDMPPNHISRWTRAGFDAIVARHGLQVVEFRTEPGSAKAFMSQDLKYYTLRQSMVKGTWASKVYESAPSLKRKLLLACVAATYLGRRLPLWIRILSQVGRLGGSVWVKIVHAAPA